MAATSEGRKAIYFMGRNIEDLSRDELIDALRVSVNEIESTRASALSMNNTWSAIAKGLVRSRA